MALERAPVLDLLRDPFTLDGVGVVDRHIGVVEGKLAHLFAAAFGAVQVGGGRKDLLGVEHGNGL
ncbi:hypothetical protein PFLmoz3_00707 [Pseudomonas fluorescens]|uniref:Uncharacterized protein n=1 Tax=Pseudomonas fluorescens TaxID=294 RepID=A0A120G8Z1_PSEFL|nr:hypothetical protein PFLmoz3_00707 [Pseudomonas fluorescens]